MGHILTYTTAKYLISVANTTSDNTWSVCVKQDGNVYINELFFYILIIKNDQMFGYFRQKNWMGKRRAVPKSRKP